jgi:hypothetical protein
VEARVPQTEYETNKESETISNSFGMNMGQETRKKVEMKLVLRTAFLVRTTFVPLCSP